MWVHGRPGPIYYKVRPMRLAPALIMLSALALLSGAAAAKPWWMHGVDSNETDFLPPDVAFRAGARLEGSLLKVRWVIADGYYLYRQKISSSSIVW